MNVKTAEATKADHRRIVQALMLFVTLLNCNAFAKYLVPALDLRMASVATPSSCPTVATSLGESNQRWCSDGFEIKCDSGRTVTATFAKDCYDREVMAWRA